MVEYHTWLASISSSSLYLGEPRVYLLAVDESLAHLFVSLDISFPSIFQQYITYVNEKREKKRKRKRKKRSCCSVSLLPNSRIYRVWSIMNNNELSSTRRGTCQVGNRVGWDRCRVLGGGGDSERKPPFYSCTLPQAEKMGLKKKHQRIFQNLPVMLSTHNPASYIWAGV